MFSKFFESGRRRAEREHGVRSLVKAINSMDFHGLSELVVADFVYSDANGSKIVGRHAFVDSVETFWKAAGSPDVVILSLHHNREEVLARGYLNSDLEGVNAEALWRVEFQGPLIAHIEVTQEEMRMTLPSLAKRKQAHEV